MGEPAGSWSLRSHLPHNKRKILNCHKMLSTCDLYLILHNNSHFLLLIFSSPHKALVMYLYELYFDCPLMMFVCVCMHGWIIFTLSNKIYFHHFIMFMLRFTNREKLKFTQNSQSHHNNLNPGKNAKFFWGLISSIRSSELYYILLVYYLENLIVVFVYYPWNEMTEN